MTWTGLLPANAGRDRQQLSQLDVLLARVGQRKRLRRKVVRREDLLVQAVGKQLRPLGQQNADGDAREALAARGEIRRRVAMAQAEVVLVDQPAVAHHQQAAVLRAPLDELERLVELLPVHAGDAANLLRILQRAPAACGIGRRKVRAPGRSPLVLDRCGRRQVPERCYTAGSSAAPLNCERKILVDLAVHEAPRRAAGHAEFRGLRAVGAHLVVLVAHDRLAVLLQRGDAGGDVLQLGGVEVDQQKVAGLGDFVRQRAAPHAAGRDEQVRRGLLGQRDQLGLARGALENRVIEAAVGELVGDLQHDVRERRCP